MSSRSRSTCRARTSKARADVFAHAPGHDHATRRARSSTRSAARRRCSRSSRRTSPTSSRSRAPRSTRGATGLTLVNTVMGLVDRRVDARAAARRGRRRRVGSADQADRAARGLGGVARASRASPIIGTGGVTHAARTRSRCCSRARPRSASAPRRSSTRARRCASSTSSTRGARSNGVAHVRDLTGGLHGRTTMTDRRRNRLAVALDVPDLDRGRTARQGGGAVVRRRQGRARAVLRRGSRGDRAACARSTSRCSPTSSCTTSPPRSAGPRACSAARAFATSTSTPPAVSTCCAPGVEGLRRRRARRRRSRTRRSRSR